MALGGTTSNLGEGVLPVTFEKFGEHSLKIVPDKPVSKLDRLRTRHIFVGDPEDIVSMDWSKEWTELK